MSMPNDNLQPPAFVSFDDLKHDEDVLFEDFYVSQEPFVSDNPDDFVNSEEQNHDELFQVIHDLADEEFDTGPQTENQDEAPCQADPEAPDIFQTISALEALLPPAKDGNSECDFHSHEPAGAVQRQEHPLPGAFLYPKSFNSCGIAEERLDQNSGPAKCHNFNAAMMQKGAGSSMMHGSQAPLITGTAMSQNQALVDARTADPNLARLDSEKKRKFPTTFEGGLMSTNPERPLDVCDSAFDPGMIPDILDPSWEGKLPNLNEYAIDIDIRNAHMSPPKRQRKSGTAPTTFSQSAKQTLKRDFDGTERPRKRTRTRIEDMDPSMVHVCNFPGCTKKFAKKYNLKIHQRRHNGDLPFLCEYAGCAKRFMWLSSFSRHLRVHESRQNCGRRRREVQAESDDPQRNDSSLERIADIAISGNFSILSVSDLKLLIENELSEDVTFACALTALDAKPCENLIPVAKIAQAKRRKLLAAGRAEEFYQHQATPYDMSNPHLQNLFQLLTVNADTDGMIDDSNPVI